MNPKKINSARRKNKEGYQPAKVTMKTDWKENKRISQGGVEHTYYKPVLINV